MRGEDLVGWREEKLSFAQSCAVKEPFRAKEGESSVEKKARSENDSLYPLLWKEY